MVQDLKQYLAEHPCKGFKPIPQYFLEGDFITWYHKDVRCYARRVDDMLTVYLAMDDHQVVGCKITGVRQLLETAGEFGVTVTGTSVKPGYFFLWGARVAREEDQKKQYRELDRLARNAEVCLPASPSGEWAGSEGLAVPLTPDPSPPTGRGE